MNKPIQTIDNIFLEAIEVSDCRSRARYLDHACNGNADLKSRVEHLLAVASRVGTFLEQPACIPTAVMESDRDTVVSYATGEMIGPYKLIRQIGEGGMGVVYLAEQEAPVRRHVAVKVIRAGMNSNQVVARFEHERQTLALMEHPNIARVLDAGATDDGQPYFAMELVNGTPITLFCDQQRLTIHDRIEMFMLVCRAVQHAHQKGIIHRDLKPSNVLVAQIDARPVPKVIDFGVAKATGQNLSGQTLFSEPGQIVGTLEYMAPEQAEPGNVDIDTRADVYALGVLLYELLAGSTPFSTGHSHGSGFVEMLRLIRDADPTRPSMTITQSDESHRIAENRRLEPHRLVRLVGGELDWIALKCLEKDRNRRYKTANDLADDLARFLDHQPVQACPPTLIYQLRKFARRHRVVLAASGSIALILILASVVSTWQAILASRAESRAIEGWKEADQQRAQTDGVNQFMYDVLTTVDPVAKGADARFVDVLKVASDSVSRRFEGFPIQEAKVRSMLGDCYSNLAMLNEATRETELAVELLKSVLQNNDQRLLRAEVKHAGALLNQSLTRQAKSVLDSLVPRVHEVFGFDNIVAIQTDRLAASLLIQLGQYQQAQHDLRQLRQHAKLVEADDAVQIAILDSLITALKTGLGLERESDIVLVPEMELLAREMFDRSLERWGPESIQSIRAQLLMADMMCRQGEFQAAADNCKEILENSKKRLGKNHLHLLSAMDILAQALHRLGHSTEAAELQLQRIEDSREFDANPIALVVNISDALPYMDRGKRWADGEALAKEYSSELAKLGGGHADLAFNARLYMAHFDSLQGRTEQAQAQFQDLLGLTEYISTYPNVIARLHLFYASHYRRQQLFEAAEEHLQTAENVVDNILRGTCDANPDDIVAEFIALYEDWDKPDKMAHYQELLKQVHFSLADQTDP